MVEIVRILRRSSRRHRRDTIRRPDPRPPVRSLQAKMDAGQCWPPAVLNRRALRDRADGGQERDGRHRRRADGRRLRRLAGVCLAVAEEMGCQKRRRPKRSWPAVDRVFIARAGRLRGSGRLQRRAFRREHGRRSPRNAGRRDADPIRAAASMAFQSMLGLICDPVAGRVEVPCLGKNVMAASNAIACANMALRISTQLFRSTKSSRRPTRQRSNAERASLHGAWRALDDANLKDDCTKTGCLPKRVPWSLTVRRIVIPSGRLLSASPMFGLRWLNQRQFTTFSTKSSGK